MADFMRGGSRPRYNLDIAGLETRFGAPLGPLLTELSRLACRLAPFEPWTAFASLEMHLVYLLAATPDDVHPATPDDVLIFLETGVDLHSAGFVDDGSGRPLDSRAVCLIREEPKIVAPDLASYLGLVAVAGAEAVDPERPDEDWLAEREERMQDEEFRSLSKELCSLRGVVLAPGKSARRKAAKRTPRVASIDIADEPRESGLARVHQLLRGGKRKQASSELIRQIGVCVSIGDLLPGDRWQEIQELVTSLRPPLPNDVRVELAKRGVRFD